MHSDPRGGFGRNVAQRVVEFMAQGATVKVLRRSGLSSIPTDRRCAFPSKILPNRRRPAGSALKVDVTRRMEARDAQAVEFEIDVADVFDALAGTGRDHRLVADLQLLADSVDLQRAFALA